MSYKTVPTQKAKPGDTNHPVNLHHEGKNDSLIKNNSFRIGVWDFTLSRMKWHPPWTLLAPAPGVHGFGEWAAPRIIPNYGLKPKIYPIVGILNRGHFELFAYFVCIWVVGIVIVDIFGISPNNIYKDSDVWPSNIFF